MAGGMQFAGTASGTETNVIASLLAAVEAAGAVNVICNRPQFAFAHQRCIVMMLNCILVVLLVLSQSIVGIGRVATVARRTSSAEQTW